MNCAKELRRPRGRLLSTMNLSSVMVKPCGTDHRGRWKLLKLEQWHPSLDPLLPFLFIGKHFSLFSLWLTFQPLVHMSFWAGIFVPHDLNIASYKWVFSFETTGCTIVLFPCALSFFQNVLIFCYCSKCCMLFVLKNFLHSQGCHKYSEINQNQISLMTTCTRLSVMIQTGHSVFD